MHRTTIQLERTLERELKQLAHDERRSLKEVINDLLRRGLAVMKQGNQKASPFSWKTAPAKPTSGFDPADRDSYFDLLDEDS